ncbi:MAG: ABC transporter ATP-binding protein [Candidatus Wallbacteria bacterium]|nr:ABC transporter ATP-binding protein [Candidatus Wallbacteria bacterium]
MVLFVGCKQIYPLMLRKIIDVLIPSKDLSLLLIYVALLAGVKLLEFSSVSVEILIGMVLSTKFTLNLKINFLKNFFMLSADSIDDLGTGAVIQRFDDDIGNIQSLIYEKLLSFARDILQIVWLLPIMIWLDVRITLLLFIVLPINVYLSIYYGDRLKLETRAFLKIRDQMNSFVFERFKNASLIKYSSSEKFEILNYIKHFRKYFSSMYSRYYLDQISKAFYQMAVDLSPLAVLGYGGYLIFQGRSTLGTILALTSYIDRLFYPIKSIFLFSNTLNQMVVSIERYENFIGESRSESCGTLKPQEIFPIVFDNVGFSYRNRNTTLCNFGLTISKGDRIGIVGESGCGKSTVIKLLMGLYQVQSGAVRFNGRCIGDIDVRHLRRRFSVVTQDILLLNASIKNNIVYNSGFSDASAINRVCDICQLNSMLSQLPEGIETKIGEGGIKLSGGEKQRVAIARALLRQTETIIFDEATSNLDAETEARLIKNIFDVFKDNTLVFIAHRLNTIKQVDRIIVMKDGCVSDSGTHEFLINTSVTYRKMWDRFRDN